MEKWKKPLRYLSMALSVAVIVGAGLQLLRLWDNGLTLAEFSMGAMFLVNGLRDWESDRKMAWVNLVSGVLILILAVAVVLVP